ncbi:GLPGLI family protein [Polaribacter sp. WD7]|uniref:GLPGLI family protein n=1 Tax=Polaribacter sp. WD7 TaxID=2269061 RepID=UPI0015EFDE1D|nr:GLPGLI family protein [Polaribacter sp. WD7]
MVFLQRNKYKKTDNRNLNESNTKRTTNTIISGRKNLIPRYFYNKKENFLFKDIHNDSDFVVKDEPNFPNWTFINKMKIISNLKTQKATTGFRGRIYIACYTTNIPLPFGSWKTRGLPSLTLELQENTGVFSIIAQTILVDKQQKCEKPAVDKEITNAISIEMYLKELDKLEGLFFEKFSDKLPKGSKSLKRAKNCEDCDKQRLEIFTDFE